MAERTDNEKMDGAVRRTVVISAVNIRRGGTLAILRECLEYLSGREDLDVTALVHGRELCSFPGIRYIEIPWSTGFWAARLWCEFVTMNRISKSLPKVDLWLSLHDTTPRVKAERQAVYCHTSFPFMRTTLKDWWYNPRIPLFAKLLGLVFRINVKQNSYVVVQQQWFRERFARLTGFDENRIIVSPPAEGTMRRDTVEMASRTTFFYPSGPDCHKNFETLCEAARMLENKYGSDVFRVILTIKGDENRYARVLLKKYGNVKSLIFAGYMQKNQMNETYLSASSLVFLSRIESWGLPISEFRSSGKPMILADLPYAHETASGASAVAFVSVDNPEEVAGAMETVISWNPGSFSPVAEKAEVPPYACGWKSLFNILINDADTSLR